MRFKAIGWGVLLAAGLVILPLARAAGPLVLDVWPGPAPGEPSGIGEETTTEPRPGQMPVTRLTNVTRPTLTVYRPDPARDTGAAVIVAPGGGYSILAWDHEGTEVAAWLNSIGVTGIVLKYRVPRRPGDSPNVPPVWPLQDAQRALSLVRSRAAEWKIDPGRIGILGFSAGGNLTARAATDFDRRAYEPIDEIDKVSCRPDFAVLIYPAYLVEEDGTTLRPEIRPSADSPPMFFAHAHDDQYSPENSIALYLALKRAGVPAELHIYSVGGHGFGLRPSDKPAATWPDRCAAWMRIQGLLDPGGREDR